jgi:hypothetical protein
MIRSLNAYLIAPRPRGDRLPLLQGLSVGPGAQASRGVRDGRHRHHEYPGRDPARGGPCRPYPRVAHLPSCVEPSSRWVMAGCDGPQDRQEARQAGYRVFRATLLASPDAKLPGEVICPASAEAGNKTNCALCRACGGHGAKAKADIPVTIRGGKAEVNATRTWMAAWNTRGWARARTDPGLNPICIYRRQGCRHEPGMGGPRDV